MKRIGLMALALGAALALSGAMASSSFAAACFRVAQPGTGNWSNPACTEKVGTQAKEFIRIDAIGPSNSAGIACALVTEINTGKYTDSQCKNEGAGEFITVYERPSWFVNGVQLKQNAKQIKLQLKGTAVLKSEIALIPVTIECKGGTSEGSTIEGEGVFQGQDKGRLTFSQCSIAAPPKCKVEEPIKTAQTKSHLVTIAGRQTKMADLFEPTEGETFATIKLINAGAGETEKCSTAGEFPVKGNVAAELLPPGVEVQEGLLNFPENPITVVLHEEEERKIGLKLGTKEAKFKAAFGARLETNEKFGVFGG